MLIAPPHTEVAKVGEPLDPSEILDYRLREKLLRSVSDIGLRERTVVMLESVGVFTVNDLLHRTEAELLQISYFGQTTMAEVYLALSRLGFTKGRPVRDRERSSPCRTRRKRRF